MIDRTRTLLCSLTTFAILAASLVQAEEKAEDGKQQPAPSERKITKSLEKLVFVPHDSGAPEVTDAGGVRAVTVLPKIELLAPERMARTLSPTPTLYWHISKATEAPLRFTLLADDVTTIDPLLEYQIDGVDQEGIYGVSLDDHGVALEDGRRYIWSIAVSGEGDGFGSDLVAQTMMEHDATPGLAETLDAGRPEERAIRLAAEGYWYDAVDTLTDQIMEGAKHPWQIARSRLFDQAGLVHAARFDRQKAGK